MDIQKMRDLLLRSKDQAALMYEDEDRSAIEALDFLYVMVDSELLKTQKLCMSCDGTGAVHRPDGEYLGACTCDSKRD